MANSTGAGAAVVRHGTFVERGSARLNLPSPVAQFPVPLSSDTAHSLSARRRGGPLTAPGAHVPLSSDTAHSLSDARRRLHRDRRSDVPLSSDTAHSLSGHPGRAGVAHHDQRAAVVRHGTFVERPSRQGRATSSGGLVPLSSDTAHSLSGPTALGLRAEGDACRCRQTRHIR